MGTGFGQRAAGEVAEALGRSRLRRLALPLNDIGDEGAAALARGIRSLSGADLDLSFKPALRLTSSSF